MEFEWDEAKAAANLAKHGMTFGEAVPIFWDENRLTIEDERLKYDERRYVVYGMIKDRLHVVVFTPRSDSIRIISARKANKREQKKHGYRSLQT
jgi:uncharacterized protein